MRENEPCSIVVARQKMPDMWRRSFEKMKEGYAAEEPSDRPQIAYLGVMALDYESAGSNPAYVPVSSASELYAQVPKGHMFVGSQLGYRRMLEGTKHAMAYSWGVEHCRLTELACGAIRVVVALMLSSLQDDELALPQEDQTLQVKAVQADLVRASASDEDLYTWLCECFSKIHSQYYGTYPSQQERIRETQHLLELLVSLLRQYCTEPGQWALQILLKLGGLRPLDWTEGLAELGREMEKEGGHFDGPLLEAWRAALQEEFEAAATRAVAGTLWVQQREKE